MREQFFSNQWKPYPAMPKGQGVAGRIVGISSTQLRVQAEPGIQSFPIPANWNHWVKILTVGDLIFIPADIRHELIVLAPHRGELADFSSKLSMIQKWNRFLQQVQDFFGDRGFVLVATPSLVTCPGTEPYLDPIQVLEKGKVPRFLPTSPELHLKKSLAGGLRKVFEIRPCFRGGESGPHHLSEFTMLEWYRAYASLDEIKQDVVDLLKHLGCEVLPQATTVAGEFQKKTNFVLSPQTKKAEIQSLVPQNTENWTWDEVFHWIFLEKIERQFDPRIPLFVEKYPAQLAAYARLDEQGWADRFELYWKGLEIANAFHEVNDPALQRQRMMEDLEKRHRMNRDKITLDEEFFAALESGMPPSGGIALGLERLFMALHDISEIQELKLWS